MSDMGICAFINGRGDWLFRFHDRDRGGANNRGIGDDVPSLNHVVIADFLI